MAKINYTSIRERAERISKMRHERLIKLCRLSGLSPSLLGIHPHNAMCGYHVGKPWPEVDYKYCKRLDYLQRTGWEFEPLDIVRKLYSAGRTDLT